MALSLKARLMPLTGRPMLSSNRVDFIRGHDLANGPADLIKALLSGLEPRSLRRAAMQPKLSRIHGGKEVPPEERNEAERNKQQRAHADEDDAPVIERPIQRSGVTIPQLVEAMVKTVVDSAEKSEGPIYQLSERPCPGAVGLPVPVIVQFGCRLAGVLRKEQRYSARGQKVDCG